MKAPNTPEQIQLQKPDKSTNGRSANPTSCGQSLAAVRLRKHSDYQRAYAAARKRQSASMSWFLAPRPLEIGQPGNPPRNSDPLTAGPTAGRVGLTAGKVLGKAHERNRIKRRMREALRRHLDLLPQGADLILHPRRVVLTMEFTKLEAEIVRILTQARTDASKFVSPPSAVSAP